MQDAKQAIVEYCKKRGALAVGVASLEACERIAPPGHRPSDLFPRVKSVISIGVGGQTPIEITDFTRGKRSLGRCPGGAMRSQASRLATPTASAPRFLQYSTMACFASCIVVY